MAPKFGTILKSKDNLFCIVVQRFYPMPKHMVPYMAISITNQDMENGFKLFRRGSTNKKNNTNNGMGVVPGIPGEKALLYSEASDNLFYFKFGFPKGGRERENINGISCAIRELKQETNITLPESMYREDMKINTRKGNTYYLVDNYEDEKSTIPHPDFEDEISEVIWLTFEQIKRLPFENTTNEFREVVKKLRGGANANFKGSLPILRNKPKKATELHMEQFTRSVVSFKLRGGVGGSKKIDNKLIKDFSSLIKLSCQKSLIEEKIKEIKQQEVSPKKKTKKNTNRL